MIKVLHIAECAGGVERYLQMLVPLLKEKNISQSLICSRSYNKNNFTGQIDSFYQIEMFQTFSIYETLKMVFCIRKIIKKEKPDIVYCHSSFGGTLGRLASIGLDLKIVYNPHGWSFNDKHISQKKRIIYALIEKCLAPLTTKYIAISNFEKCNALQYKITKPNKIQVIKNGLEINKFLSRNTKSRKLLGIPENATVIGMVGRLSIGKSPDVFIKMASILKNKISDAFFIIVGDGEERKFCDKLIRDLKMESCFMITGWVDNVFDYENSFDYAVLLTKWEGFGLAVAEYMLCKKPFVSTKVGGIPDIVSNGETGILLDSIDEKSAANAIFNLYNDRELSNKLVDNAYNYVCKELDVQRTAEEHYNLFVNLIDCC